MEETRKRGMEEIREVALAYYANANNDCKLEMRNFFNNMDTDHNGIISLSEFRTYMKKTYPGFDLVEVFSQLDHDGDGVLSFDEVVVFYYMVTFRKRSCDGIRCGIFLNKVYFTCVRCFLDRDNTESFDICLKCYQAKNYNHRVDHNLFLDNYIMLDVSHSELKKKELENALATTNNQLTRQLSHAGSVDVQNRDQYYTTQGTSYYGLPHPNNIRPQVALYNLYQPQYYMTHGGSVVSSYALLPNNHYQNHYNVGGLGSALGTISSGCSIVASIVQLATAGVCTIM